MADKREFDDFMTSESGNWNVAQDYARLKIMKLLYITDEYEIVATFGYSGLSEEIQSNKSNDHVKIYALKRLVKYLLMLINNTSFAIKNDNDKTKFKDWKKELERIYEIIPTLHETKRNTVAKTSEVYLVKSKYDMILKKIVDIKSDLNEPLNKNDLIFRYVEEFDPVKYKEEFMKDMMRG